MIKQKIRQTTSLMMLSLTLCQPISLLGGQQEDQTRDIRAKEIVKARHPDIRAKEVEKGRRPSTKTQQTYSAPKEFPDGPPPRSGTYVTVGVTLWRVREATEVENKDSKIPKEWMNWDQADHEVVVTRISDRSPIPSQDLIQITIEYLPNQDKENSNRAGYFYVINREQFPDGSLRNARLIFPTQLTYEGDNRLLPGQTVTLPGPNRPFIINRAVVGQAQTSEVYTIVFSPVSLNALLPQPLGRKAMELTPEFVAGWEKRLGKREVRAELKGGLGQSRTQRELGASGDIEETRGTKDSAENLTQEDMPPQTVFRTVTKPRSGMLFTVRVPFDGARNKQ